jgi:hypothetical protein
MPIETTPEAERRVADDADNDVETPARFPIFRTILAGYRIVGENFISFIAVTVILAAVHFGLMKVSPFVRGTGELSIRDGVLQLALGLASTILTSAVFGIAGVRWYRRILLDERRQRFTRFGQRELQFAVCMFLFYLVLTAAAAITPAYWREIGAYLLHQSFGYSLELFGPTVMFLWHVLAVALFFFTFPAIAVDVGRPLEQSLRLARHALPRLILFYLIGLVPWIALDKFGGRALLFHIDTDRLFFAAIALNTWTTTCSFALAAAAYREIAGRQLHHRLVADFE